MVVKVTLNGDGLNYETDADVVQAAKIIGFLNMSDTLQGAGSLETVKYPAGVPGSFIGEEAKSITSPREAVLESGAKTNAQKILVLGNYLLQRDNVEVFVPSELKSIFIKAGEPAPKNLGRDVETAIRQGYITENVDVSGEYIITNTGYKALQDGFGGQKAKKRTARRSGVKSRERTAEQPAWIEDVNVEDHIDGYRSYRSMETRADKILWILLWAKLNNHEKLNGVEISAVADKLSTNVPNRQIAAAMTPYLSKDYVSKNSEGYKIMHEGVQYLGAAGE